MSNPYMSDEVAAELVILWTIDKVPLPDIDNESPLSNSMDFIVRDITFSEFLYKFNK